MGLFHFFSHKKNNSLPEKERAHLPVRLRGISIKPIEAVTEALLLDSVNTITSIKGEMLLLEPNKIVNNIEFLKARKAYDGYCLQVCIRKEGNRYLYEDYCTKDQLEKRLLTYYKIGNILSLEQYNSVPYVSVEEEQLFAELSSMIQNGTITETELSAIQNINMLYLGNTLLHEACSHHDLKTIHYLLEKGADPYIKDRNGDSPLIHAIRIKSEQNTAIIEAFSKYGELDINAQKLIEEIANINLRESNIPAYIIALIVRVIKEQLSLHFPDITMKELEQNGSVYYLNQAQDTEACWYLNQKFAPFAVFYRNQKQKKACVLELNRRGIFTLFMYDPADPTQKKTVTKGTNLTEKELLEFAVYLKNVIDDSQILDADISTFDISCHITHSQIRNFQYNKSAYFRPKYDRNEERFQQLKSIVNDLSKNEIRISYHESKQAIPALCSKIGGKPDLPEGFKWPYYDSVPLTFLAQYNLEELSAYDTDHLLPTEGILSFFYYMHPDDLLLEVCQDNHDGMKVCYFHDPSALTQITLSPEIEATLLPEFELTFENKKAYCLDRLANDLSEKQWKELKLSDFDDELERYVYDTPDEEASRMKLLGIANHIQNPMEERCNELSNRHYNWILLFQMNSIISDSINLSFGDLGNLYFWISKSDLESMDFNHCCMVLQCT